MGIDDIGLDDTIDRNSFTVEQAAEVFKKAAEAVKGDDLEVAKKLLDAGFDLISVVAHLFKKEP